MNKSFWKDIQENDCKIPEDHTVDSLTPELLYLLGSTDSELRDNLALEILCEWVVRGLYSPDELKKITAVLLSNLVAGIGEEGTDSVFLRAFSVLVLRAIVYHDSGKSFLQTKEFKEIFDKGLWYLTAENDPRGYVPVKGWAHSLAHTADLINELGKNRHTVAEDHDRILGGIAKKLIESSNWVYVHGEDDRLSRPVLTVFRRGLLEPTTIKEWLASLTTPENSSWKGAWTKEESTRAFFNVRNFLRSLYLQVATEDGLSQQKELEKIILDAVQNLQPY